MKLNKTLLLAILMIALNAIMFAQYTTVDFEPNGIGADWNWTVGENGGNPALQFPVNPVSGGINTSWKVAQFTALDAGMDWALCFTDDVETFQFNATNSIVKIMVYKPVISPVAIKFELGSTPLELQVANTVINQWQELTFDFSAVIGNTYSRIVIIPDFAPRNQDNIIYFDNIRIPTANITPPSVPTVAAPTPTENPANVISMFSNAYTNVTVDTWSAGWDQADVADVQIAGNDTKLYTNLTYAGIEFTSQTINATAMSHFHMDIWTPDPTVLPAAFKMKLVDFGANGVWGGGDDVEHELSFNAVSAPPLVSENWISFDIPMSNFTNLVTRAHLAQLIISGDPNTVYVDNVYFFSSTVAGNDATLSDLRVDGSTISGFSSLTENYTVGLLEGTTIIPQITQATTTDPTATYNIMQATAIPGTASVVVTAQDGITLKTYNVYFVIAYPNSLPPTPMQDPNNVISLYSNAYTSVAVDTWLTPWSQGVLEEVRILGNDVFKYTAVNFVGIEATGANLIDISSMSHLHLNLWTPDTNVFKVKLVDWGDGGVWGGGDDTEYEVNFTAPETGTWISYDIPLTAFTDLAITGHLAQIILSKPVLGTMYIDNMYFYVGLDAPSNVAISSTATQVTLTWDAIPGATSYVVRSALKPSGPFSTATDGTYNGNSWSTTVTGPKKFYYVTASSDQ